MNTSGPWDGDPPLDEIEDRNNAGGYHDQHVIRALLDVIDKAIVVGLRYGSFDGSHHKAYAIDQMLRVLAGSRYDDYIAAHCAGEDGPDTYEHDVGCAP